MRAKKWWTALLIVVTAAVHSTNSVAAEPVRLVAYINQASGCQKHTENFLTELAKSYDGKLTVEMVDFGGAGRKRWLADGMHCMGIKVNDKLVHSVWSKGVEIPVTFKMPAGYMWTHEDLGTLIRQIIEGVSPEDKRPPSAETTVTEKGRYALLIASRSVLELDKEKYIVPLAAALNEAAKQKPILQEEFSISITDSMVKLSLRGKVLAELPVETVVGAGQDSSLQAASAKLSALVSAYPRKARPFPGMKMPFRRK